MPIGITAHRRKTDADKRHYVTNGTTHRSAAMSGP
jgi:hypothetical protein